MKFALKIPQVTHCCCGCDLRTGSFLIALLITLCGVLNILYAVELLGNEDEQSKIQNLVTLSGGIVYLLCGVCIACGALAKQTVLVKVPSLITLVTWVVNLVMASVLFASYQQFFTILSGILAFGLLCYFVIVLWSYTPVPEVVIDTGTVEGFDGVEIVEKLKNVVKEKPATTTDT